MAGTRAARFITSSFVHWITSSLENHPSGVVFAQPRNIGHARGSVSTLEALDRLDCMRTAARYACAVSSTDQVADARQTRA